MPSGVRNVLDNAVDRAVSSRHAEFVYLTSLVVTGAVSAGLLWVARRLSRV
jgi:hypothetical protein